jgi:hypothetical protein
MFVKVPMDKTNRKLNQEKKFWKRKREQLHWLKKGWLNLKKKNYCKNRKNLKS